MSRLALPGQLASSALPRLMFLAALLLGAPVAARWLESWVGYVRWRVGPGSGLVHAAGTRPLEVLLHVRDLGNPPIDDRDGRAACAAGDVDGDGYGDLWILSALGPGADAGGGMASLVSGRTRGILRKARQYDMRAANFSVDNTGDVDGDGIDDLLIAQGFYNGARIYWVRSGASGRLLQDVQRRRTNMHAPVYVEPIAGGRTRLAVARAPRDFPTPSTVDHVDPASGSSLGEAELPPIVPHLIVEDLGDIDGDGWAEYGGWAGSGLLMDRLEIIWSSELVTKLVKSNSSVALRIDTAGDFDADGVPDVLVEASQAEGPGGSWHGELWVLSGASLVER